MTALQKRFVSLTITVSGLLLLCSLPLLAQAQDKPSVSDGGAQRKPIPIAKIDRKTPVDFEKEIADTERRYLLAALEKAGGVRTRASELLKITYRSFRHYAKKHGL